MWVLPSRTWWCSRGDRREWLRNTAAQDNTGDTYRRRSHNSVRWNSVSCFLGRDGARKHWNLNTAAISTRTQIYGNFWKSKSLLGAKKSWEIFPNWSRKFLLRIFFLNWGLCTTGSTGWDAGSLRIHGKMMKHLPGVAVLLDVNLRYVYVCLEYSKMCMNVL